MELIMTMGKVKCNQTKSSQLVILVMAMLLIPFGSTFAGDGDSFDDGYGYDYGDQQPGDGVQHSSCEWIDYQSEPSLRAEYKACVRLALTQSYDGEIDCIECLFHEEQSQGSELGKTVRAALGPLAYVAATYFGYKGQTHQADAYSNAIISGHEQCTMRYNSFADNRVRMANDFYDYYVTTGANPISPDQATSYAEAFGNGPQCNGSGMGSYAGMGGMYGNGYGGFGSPWGAAGYSPGFMNGMLGPGMGGFGSGGGFGAGGGFGGGYGGGFGGPGMGGGYGGGFGGPGMGGGY
ncbi:MAG: hypothetical protein HN482_04905, partial [Bdellovibrionales bacterium]|nr:hypothetical protein [Bdellovibrionales bacterium]